MLTETGQLYRGSQGIYRLLYLCLHVIKFDCVNYIAAGDAWRKNNVFI